MNIQHETTRGVIRTAARAGTLVCAVMVLVSLLSFLRAPAHTAHAAAAAGVARVVTPSDGSPGAGSPLDQGTSATEFSLFLPADAACTGDSANQDYRVQSYFVPVAVDPATLTFTSAGPVPSGAATDFQLPLFTSVGSGSSGYVNQQTAAAATTGGPGPVVNIPAFDLEVYKEIGRVPDGRYNLGIACTLGVASATQLDKFWNAQVDVEADPGDAPSGVRWTAIEAAPPDTTTTTTTTTTSTTTTTTGGSTTTGADSTMTTTGDSTTTTAGGDPTTTAPDGGDPGGPAPTAADPTFPTGGGPTTNAPVVGSLGGLAATGSSVTALLVWATLFVIFGRMAYLLGRPPRVRPAAR